MIVKFYKEVKSDVELLFSAFKREGSFVKNLSYLFGGKIAIVLLMLATTPLLTRLYTPEEYGYFSFLNAAAMNFSVFASLGYPLAMVVAPSSREFYNLLCLSFLLMIITSSIVSAGLIIWANRIIPFSSIVNSNTEYVTLLIFSLLIFSTMSILPRWNVWRNQFRQGASINILVNIGSRVTSLGIGFVGGHSFGLIFGELTGKILGLIANLKLNFFKERKDIVRLVSRHDIIFVLKKYKDYPRYVLTSNYLITLMGQIPIFVFPFFFESRVLGSYSLALGLLNLPGLLIAIPLSSIYLKKIALLQQQEEQQVPVFVRKLFRGLVLTSIIPFVALSVWSIDLFTLFFGARWEMAGMFGGILALYGLFELLQISLQSVMLVYRKERALFRYSLMQISLTALLFLPGVLRNDPVEAIFGFSIARVIGSLIVIGNSLAISKIKPLPVLIRLCSLFLLLFVIFKGLDFLLF